MLQQSVADEVLDAQVQRMQSEARKRPHYVSHPNFSFHVIFACITACHCTELEMEKSFVTEHQLTLHQKISPRAFAMAFHNHCSRAMTEEKHSTERDEI